MQDDPYDPEEEWVANANIIIEFDNDQLKQVEEKEVVVEGVAQGDVDGIASGKEKDVRIYI